MFNKIHLALAGVLLVTSFTCMTGHAASQKDSSAVLLPNANYSTSLEFSQVTHVVATQESSGSWCFDTSVRHNDQGWEHYAVRWEVIDLKGNKLGQRRLGHPHNKEQPFTRSQCNLKIPSGISKVVVRAKCNKHGFGGKPIVVNLNINKGDGYLVSRANLVNSAN